ncbi:hypothetical protein OG749_02350 [Streptomyces nojiriensis]|uniref:hypothetical protein n=1 Tax=Streptomyces nojiriensis TaxID=66374 RepID=UPI002E174AB0
MAGHTHDTGELPADELRDIAQAAADLQADLQRRLRAMVVRLRDGGTSWADLAALLYGDPSKRSSARAVYDAGLRQLGRAVPERAPKDGIAADVINGGIFFNGGPAED